MRPLRRRPCSTSRRPRPAAGAAHSVAVAIAFASFQRMRPEPGSRELRTAQIPMGKPGALGVVADRQQGFATGAFRAFRAGALPLSSGLVLSSATTARSSVRRRPAFSFFAFIRLCIVRPAVAIDQISDNRYWRTLVPGYFPGGTTLFHNQIGDKIWWHCKGSLRRRVMTGRAGRAPGIKPATKVGVAEVADRASQGARYCGWWLPRVWWGSFLPFVVACSSAGAAKENAQGNRRPLERKLP